MKIVSTADWHMKNNDSYGVYDSSGVNDFLYERYNVGSRIITTATELDAHLIHAGDLIDDKVIDAVTLYYSSQLVKEATLARFVLFIEGNHGFDGRDNKHSIIAHWKFLAGKTVHIVTYPKIVRKDGIAYHCIPAISDIEKLFPTIVNDFLKKRMKSDTANILVFHGPIISARFDSGFKAKTGVKFEYIQKAAKAYDYIICGDFHRYQKLLPNVWYTGSPIQTSMRDKNQKKGYQVLDLSSGKMKFVEVDSFRFVEMEWDFNKTICPVLAHPEKFKGVLNNAIVLIRLRYKMKHDYLDRLEHIRRKLEENGARRVFIDKKTKEAKKKRASISANMSFQQMVEAYVDFKRNTLPARKRKVVEQGLLYLR